MLKNAVLDAKICGNFAKINRPSGQEGYTNTKGNAFRNKSEEAIWHLYVGVLYAIHINVKCNVSVGSLEI